MALFNEEEKDIESTYHEFITQADIADLHENKDFLERVANLLQLKRDNCLVKALKLKVIINHV